LFIFFLYHLILKAISLYTDNRDLLEVIGHFAFKLRKMRIKCLIIKMKAPIENRNY